MYSDKYLRTEIVICALHIWATVDIGSQYNTIQYNTIQYNTIQYKTMQYFIQQS